MKSSLPEGQKGKDDLDIWNPVIYIQTIDKNS